MDSDRLYPYSGGGDADDGFFCEPFEHKALLYNRAGSVYSGIRAVRFRVESAGADSLSSGSGCWRCYALPARDHTALRLIPGASAWSGHWSPGYLVVDGARDWSDAWRLSRHLRQLAADLLHQCASRDCRDNFGASAFAPEPF